MDVYEERAADWARQRPPQHRERAADFAERCLDSRVRLDVGCGPGSYFADLGSPLAGLDGAHAMLALGRQVRPDALLVQADLARLPFARASLGGAWARASYLHLPRQALPAALADLHAALAPGAPFELTMREGDDEGPLDGGRFSRPVLRPVAGRSAFRRPHRRRLHRRGTEPQRRMADRAHQPGPDPARLRRPGHEGARVRPQPQPGGRRCRLRLRRAHQPLLAGGAGERPGLGGPPAAGLAGPGRGRDDRSGQAGHQGRR